ncbi:MAG TPA: SUMF1/EgtB/PvdO family nonheme iron enzyme [Polyangiaceae bacterium]
MRKNVTIPVLGGAAVTLMCAFVASEPRLARADTNASDTAQPSHELCNWRDDDRNGLVDDGISCAAIARDSNPVRIPTNRLRMGSRDGEGAADEHPQHEVSVSAFALDRYEVTNQRYAACVAAGACGLPKFLGSAKRRAYFDNPQYGEYPVIFVSWADANQFCRWDGGRLPTEAEWELAARGVAPDDRQFPWGNEAPDCARANMGGDKSCVGDTDLTGRRPHGASPFGAMDMAGNVWEWVADWYDAEYYKHSPKQDPEGPASGNLKVMRGGCWMSGADSLRVSCRKAELPDSWAPNVGFRCARREGK